MWKRIPLFVPLFCSLCWAAVAQFDQIDNIAILRFIYPNQSLTTSETQKDPNQTRRYQVGLAENQTAAVLGRLVGKFTQPDTPELLAMVGVDTGDAAAPIATGIYPLLLRLDKQGAPQLVARSIELQRKIPPFAAKFWRPVLATDIDFDKQDDLIMLEGDARSGAERYSVYRWGGKDFVAITDHPALALLAFYAHLDSAAHLGAGEGAGESQLAAAFEQFSPKLQSQQTVESLRRRIQGAKGVEIESFKVLIKSETSALIRLQYSFVGVAGDGAQQFQGDYQVKRLDERWQIDSERLKAVSTQATN